MNRKKNKKIPSYDVGYKRSPIIQTGQMVGNENRQTRKDMMALCGCSAYVGTRTCITTGILASQSSFEFQYGEPIKHTKL